MWIDAICIDQENEKEKEHQLPLMAEIYAKARSVVVWLGRDENNSDQALEAIRLAGQNPEISSDADLVQEALMHLLHRPWFRRIWVGS